MLPKGLPLGGLEFAWRTYSYSVSGFRFVRGSQSHTSSSSRFLNMADLSCYALSPAGPNGEPQQWRQLPKVEDELKSGTFLDLYAHLRDGSAVAFVPSDPASSAVMNHFMRTGEVLPGDREHLIDLASAFLADFDVPVQALEAPQAPAGTVHCVVVPSNRAEHRICDLFFEIFDPDETGYQPMSFRLVQWSAWDTANAFLGAAPSTNASASGNVSLARPWAIAVESACVANL